MPKNAIMFAHDLRSFWALEVYLWASHKSLGPRWKVSAPGTGAGQSRQTLVTYLDNKRLIVNADHSRRTESEEIYCFLYLVGPYEILRHMVCSSSILKGNLQPFPKHLLSCHCASPGYPSICSQLLPGFQKVIRISGTESHPCCSPHRQELISFLYLCCHFSGVGKQGRQTCELGLEPEAPHFFFRLCKPPPAPPSWAATPWLLLQRHVGPPTSLSLRSP